MKKKLNCDQVCWVIAILDRYAEAQTKQYPGISRLKQVSKLGALLELMEILGYEFEDEASAGNAIADITEFNKLRGYDG